MIEEESTEESKLDTTALLFDISREVKHFYETPVIFITKKDFSDVVFNVMCTIRNLLDEENDNKKNRIMDVIVDYHLQWMHSINDIENFQTRFNEVSELPRDEVVQAISFTTDSMGYRLKYYQRYMEKYRKGLSNVNQSNISAELEIVEEMHKDVAYALVEKLKCFQSYCGDEEFKLKVNNEIDELLNWLDKISDNLALTLSKYVNVNLPHFSGDLTKTLQQIVEELQTANTPSAQKMLEELKEKGKELGTMIRCTAGHNLEISKVVEKITILKDRIKRLASQNATAAVLALQHKKDFLQGRLASLDKLKTSLKCMNKLVDMSLTDVAEEELCVCEDFFQLRIFNHSLPRADRERLVTELCYLWDLAVFGEKHRSIISILSATEMKEEFTDDLGTYYIDEYNRKIYKFPEDETLYQCNERNELVPLADDADHIYYYDDCGRYFLDTKTRQRIYKAHAEASEYMMDICGVLLKSKEERDGVTYYYDNYGRYYIDSDGKHIYREPDAVSEYENDGLGNLVRIRSHLDIFEPCPDDENVTEDFRYLKQNVGEALRQCIAETILRQPADPIKFLSTSLIKYRDNIEQREKRAREKEELDAEREIMAAEERIAAERAKMEAELLMHGGSEASFDSNMIRYQSLTQADATSASTR